MPTNYSTRCCAQRHGTHRRKRRVAPPTTARCFIHLSARPTRGTLLRHFAGETGLIALEIAADRLGAGLKWEPSRDGALFPHLYDALPLDAILRTFPLPSPSIESTVKGEAS